MWKRRATTPPIIAVNQLSIYEAEADGCKDLAQCMGEERSGSKGNPVAEDNSEAMMALAGASTSAKSLLTQEGAPGNLWQRH